MPAPKKVELPKRKRHADRGFCWGNFVFGIAVGVLSTWLVMSGTIDFQSLLQEEPAIPVIDKTEPPADTQNDILDNLPIEFYKLLPNREEQIPDHVISEKARADSTKTPLETAVHYRLQAGSFQKLTDADRRRASILIIGLETHIEKVTHGGKTWHRVMLGPFETLRHLETAKQRLKENRIDSITLKLKQPGN